MPFKFPFYAKASLIFTGLLSFVYILFIAQKVIVPVIFSVIVAIILHPVVMFLVRLRINRVVAIIITLIFTTLFLASIGFFLISQASRFSESLPQMIEKFGLMFNEAINWASNYFDISPKKILSWISKTKGEILSNSGEVIGKTLISVGGVLILLVLIPVYIFMALFYQPLLLEFIRRLFGSTNRGKVSEIISQIKTVLQRYLTGLVIEAALVSTMHAIGLTILGIDYALMLGIIGGLLNMIPYLGGLVAVALPMAIALVTKASPFYPLYVLGVYYFVQLIDNNYIVPKIVASKVKLNALVSIFVVIAFGALWGIPGMFLSIPLTAIIKLIFDHIESLKPWGFVLGDTMPEINIIKSKAKKKGIIKN